MQNEIGQSINRRSKAAIDHLIEIGKIDKFYIFCDEFGFNRRNLTRLFAEPTREFPLHLLTILVEEYGVSPDYLRLGIGPILRPRFD